MAGHRRETSMASLSTRRSEVSCQPPARGQYGPNAAWSKGGYLGQVDLVEIVDNGHEIERLTSSAVEPYFAMVAAAKASDVTVRDKQWILVLPPNRNSRGKASVKVSAASTRQRNRATPTIRTALPWILRLSVAPAIRLTTGLWSMPLRLASRERSAASPGTGVRSAEGPECQEQRHFQIARRLRLMPLIGLQRRCGSSQRYASPRATRPVASSPPLLRLPQHSTGSSA